MPQLSVWKSRHSNSYKFIDNQVRKIFKINGTGLNLHKYLGTKPPVTPTPGTPTNTTVNPLNIQDFLLLENRDRTYDSAVYNMRSVYQVTDTDFDLSQFGLMMATGTIFLLFHTNDMVERIGRKIMSGDVVELEHLKDYFPLTADSLTSSLKRYYVVTECTNAAEGYSMTWWPHLWRCKAQPLTDSQEYQDIINQIIQENTPPGQTLDPNTRPGAGTYNTDIAINDAILAEAEYYTPKSGYNTKPFYTVTVGVDGEPVDPSDPLSLNADNQFGNPQRKGYQVWLSGDGNPPDGLPATVGVQFPINATDGDYCLRIDYYPNRLFQFRGTTWYKVEDNVRTNYSPGNTDRNKTQKQQFVNNTIQSELQDRTLIPQRQMLSQILKPKADN